MAKQRFVRRMHRWQRYAALWRPSLFRFGILFAVGCVLLFVGLAMFSPLFSVREIRVDRNDLRLDLEHIHTALHPLFRRHLLFLSSEEIAPLLAAELPKLKRSAVPDIASLSVERVYPSTLRVSVTLEPIVARITVDMPSGSAIAQTQTGSGLKEFLTDRGRYVTYSSTQVASGSALPLIHVTDWAARPSPWRIMIDPNITQTMREAEHMLKTELNQTVTLRTVFLQAREFHLKVGTYSLWFDMKSSLADQMARYRTFLNTAGVGAVKEYVDLRIKDKIIYR